MFSKPYKFLAVASFLCVLGAILSLSSPGFTAEKSSTIAWGNDLNEALRQASQTGQPVLVHFYSDNCVPCKMLDAKAFKSPLLGDAMARTVLPVKINYDQHRDIAQRFQISRFPTDLFLHPNGEELYRTVSPQDPADYSKLLDRVAMKNRDWVVQRMSKLSTATANSRSLTPSSFDTTSMRDNRPVSTQGSVFQTSSNGKEVEPEPNSYCLAPTGNDEVPVVVADELPGGLFHLASQTSEVKENRYQKQAAKDSSQANSPSKHTSLLSGKPNTQEEPMAAVTMGGVFAEDSTLGLDGYCPISLISQKTWTLGRDTFAVKHRGRIYRCVSEEARALFLQEPDRYSPVLSGYDVVHFLETGELIAGMREHGFEYLGRVFVFMNEANKIHFDTNATQYAQNINALIGSERVATGTNASAVQR